MNKNLIPFFHYLEKEKIPIDQSEFEFQIQSHPNYPSLLAISDTLTFFKIKNLATRIEDDDLVHLPDNFIALIQDKKLISNLTFVEKTKNGYTYLDDGVVVEKNEVEFFEAFQNIVLLAEKEESDQVEPKNSNPRVFLVSSLHGLIYLTLVFINGFSLIVGLFICLASVGIYLSYEAISSEFGIKTKFSEAVCTITTNADCSAVLNAVKSKIIEKIGFSTVSIAFFVLRFLGFCCFLFSTNNSNFLISLQFFCFYPLQ